MVVKQLVALTFAIKPHVSQMFDHIKHGLVPVADILSYYQLAAIQYVRRDKFFIIDENPDDGHFSAFLINFQFLKINLLFLMKSRKKKRMYGRALQ